MYDSWVIVTAGLVAINASLLGVFLVVRQLSMVGDAISHAVLPGIVVAYFASGDRGSVWMLPAAALTGVAAVLLIDGLRRRVRVQSDAAIGMVYTLLFAVGVILIAGWLKGNVDVDMACVLYGDIALIQLDKVIVDGNLYIGPRAFYVEAVATLVIGAVVAAGWKGFVLLSFDSDYGMSLGVRTQRWHYGLMGLVSLVTVVSFEVVGAVLVVGFLIIPAATAQLVSHRLKPMLVAAGLFGVTAVLIGYALAVYWNVSIAGCMVTAAGGVFLLTAVCQRARRFWRRGGKGAGGV